jgi:hypothetical protein
MPQESTAYTFARIVNRKYKLGSDRRALALFWLASMSKQTIEAWGNDTLKDAEIIKRADKLGLVSTTPWLEKNAEETSPPQ